MRRIIIATIVLLMAQPGLFGWGRPGHEIVIAIAKNHISETTRQNIARYMPYDMMKDAVWMDEHRNDAEIAYTTNWHVFSVDGKGKYDPNARLGKEDAIYALALADYNLSRLDELDDDTILFNIRVLIHMVGDMHCPTHTIYPKMPTSGKRYVGDVEIKSFHTLYDRMPTYIWGSKPSAEIAGEIDNAKKSYIRNAQKGCPVSWASDCAKRCEGIYEFNALDQVELDPATFEKSRDIVEAQLRDAGYRLASLLDKYFGK